MVTMEADFNFYTVNFSPFILGIGNKTIKTTFRQ